MLGLLKSLPIIILLAGAGYAGHKFVVGQLEGRIGVLQKQVDVLNQQNVALQTAAEINEKTIRGLEEKSKQQVAQMGALTDRNNELNAQRDQYMQIFRNHDLTKLARAKPGLIESRANKATSEVFRGVESDSRELDQLDTQVGEEQFENKQAETSQ